MNKVIERETATEVKSRSSPRAIKQDGSKNSTERIKQHPLTACPDLNFPGRLFIMLERATAEGFDDVVSWLSHIDNATFKVHKTYKFESTVLPRFFLTSKYASFTRQLHAYNFKWIQKGPAKGGFCNPKFCKSNPSDCFTLGRRPKYSKTSRMIQQVSLRESSAPSSASRNFLAGYGKKKTLSTESLLIPPLHQRRRASATLVENSTIENKSPSCYHHGYHNSMYSPRRMVANSMCRNNIGCRSTTTVPPEPYTANCTRRGLSNCCQEQLINSSAVGRLSADVVIQEKKKKKEEEEEDYDDLKDDKEQTVVVVEDMSGVILDPTSEDHATTITTSFVQALRHVQEAQQWRIVFVASTDENFLCVKQHPSTQSQDVGHTIPNFSNLQAILHTRTNNNDPRNSNAVPRHHSTSSTTTETEIRVVLRPRSIEEMIRDPRPCYQGIQSFRLLTSRSSFTEDETRYLA